MLRMADLASRAGLHGDRVQRGPRRRRFVRRIRRPLALLVPGIRLQEGASHDQRRVMTPSAARSAGARYLILGRAVTAAPDPVAAMRRGRWRRSR